MRPTINIQSILIPLLAGILIGCGSDKQAETPATPNDWYKPELHVTWQWQLDGTLNTHYPVQLYDIDLFNTSKATIKDLQASNKKVICYFSAGSYEDFREDKEQFLADELGAVVPDWDNERWLDIRSSNVRRIMSARLDLAQSKGCDGVEPDLLDSYKKGTGFDLTAEDQLSYNRFIANEAHKRGLAVGLKNDLEQIEVLVDYFDFAVNEQCFEYDECTALETFINHGKPVLQAEYLSRYVNDEAQRRTLCQQSQDKQFSTLILPVALDDAFRFSCL